MATGPRYVVKSRRRRLGITDYPQRVRLLKSRMLRLVIRKSDKYISAQVVEYSQKGDKTLATAHSSELKGLGWQHGMKSTPAAYLTGLLLGRRAGNKEAILDIGIHSVTTGAKMFAALKGATDAGLKVKHDAKVLPSADRIAGKHIATHLKANFSDFDVVKKKIMELQ